MDSCCRLSSERTITPGQYLETVLETQSGGPLHTEEEFMDQLAEFIMERYEGSPITDLKSLPGVKLNRPGRTKHHYRRLFDNEGVPSLDFLTWSSETIALWIEKTLARSVYAEAGLPHASDPAYDVLSILRNGNDTKLRITQVKATKTNIQAKSNEAITKFDLLERGYYDAEISARLELIQMRLDAPAGVDVKELLYDPERRYRVVVVHEQEKIGISILTTYDTKIPGGVARRSACLIKVEWPMFWRTLGEKVYEQLS